MLERVVANVVRPDEGLLVPVGGGRLWVPNYAGINQYGYFENFLITEPSTLRVTCQFTDLERLTGYVFDSLDLGFYRVRLASFSGSFTLLSGSVGDLSVVDLGNHCYELTVRNLPANTLINYISCRNSKAEFFTGQIHSIQITRDVDETLIHDFKSIVRSAKMPTTSILADMANNGVEYTVTPDSANITLANANYDPDTKTWFYKSGDGSWEHLQQHTNEGEATLITVEVLEALGGDVRFETWVEGVYSGSRVYLDTPKIFSRELHNGGTGTYWRITTGSVQSEKTRFRVSVKTYPNAGKLINLGTDQPWVLKK